LKMCCFDKYSKNIRDRRSVHLGGVKKLFSKSKKV